MSVFLQSSFHSSLILRLHDQGNKTKKNALDVIFSLKSDFRCHFTQKKNDHYNPLHATECKGLQVPVLGH